jgi:hypothetical protein
MKVYVKSVEFGDFGVITCPDCVLNSSKSVTSLCEIHSKTEIDKAKSMILQQVYILQQKIKDLELAKSPVTLTKERNDYCCINEFSFELNNNNF